MKAIIISLALMLSVVMSLYLGDWLPNHLPNLSSYLDRKPFNCRPCCTFHLTWIFIGAMAIFQQSMALLVAGFIIAFIVFFIIRKIDNNKIIE